MRNPSQRDLYLNATFGFEDPELAGVRETLREHGVEHMAISAHEARLLQFLIRGFGIRRLVEIGTLFGYSTLAMAKALPSDGQLITLEKEPRHWQIAQRTLAGQTQVDSRCGDAVELLKTLPGPYDMVFIDANKGGYAQYLDWAESAVRRGGLIVGDNTFLWGAVYDAPERENIGTGATRALKAFNQRLADPERFNSTLLPTSEGLTVAQKLF